MLTTKLSTKGQIVLAKNVRTSRAWGIGTEFTVEETKMEFCSGRPAVSPKPLSTRLPAACDPNAQRKHRSR
jgi:hypothetical protein